jgi:hypothetical protein
MKLSLFIDVTLDFGQIWESDGVCGYYCGASAPPTDDCSINGSAIAQRRNLPPRPIADRLNAMLAKTAKEILETFRLFESLSIPAKRRMRAITGDILPLTKFHKCKLV